MESRRSYSLSGTFNISQGFTVTAKFSECVSGAANVGTTKPVAQERLTVR
jgi:hypothetical protein